VRFRDRLVVRASRRFFCVQSIQHVAGVLDGQGQVPAAGMRLCSAVEPAGEETRDRGQEFAVAVQRPGGELLRRRVDRDGAVLHVEHAGREVQATLHAVLGEDDGGACVLRESAHGGEQLLGAHGVELRGGLVEEQKVRLRGDDSGEGDLLELASGEFRQRGVAQARKAEGDERLLDEAGDGVAVDAEVLEAEGDLALDGGHDGLVFGVLEDQAHPAGEVVWPRRARVELVHGDASGERAPVEVRDQTVQGAQQRRLAAAGAAEHEDHLGGLDVQGHVVQGGTLRPGVGVGHLLEACDRGHRRDPPSAVPTGRTRATTRTSHHMSNNWTHGSSIRGKKS